MNNKVRVGNVEITALSDGFILADPAVFFPAVPVENWRQYPGALTPEGELYIPIGTFLVYSQGRTILVDTGLGPVLPEGPDQPGDRGGELLESFENNGLRPEEVDLVVMTHLHRDHVGWNVVKDDGGYKATFPKARYLMPRIDWEFFRLPSPQEVAEKVNPQLPAFQRAVLPLSELDVMQLIEGEHTITGEITTLPAPGHTPGHTALLITSGGERAAIIGDAAHHPVQANETDWCARADIYPDQARSTRRALFDRLEQEGFLVIGSHFPVPGFGRLVRLEGRRYWRAL